MSIHRRHSERAGGHPFESSRPIVALLSLQAVSAMALSIEEATIADVQPVYRPGQVVLTW